MREIAFFPLALSFDKSIMSAPPGFGRASSILTRSSDNGRRISSTGPLILFLLIVSRISD